MLQTKRVPVLTYQEKQRVLSSEVKLAEDRDIILQLDLVGQLLRTENGVQESLATVLSDKLLALYKQLTTQVICDSYLMSAVKRTLKISFDIRKTSFAEFKDKQVI